MTILEYYKKMSEDSKIHDLYSFCGTTQSLRRLGDKPQGNVYWFRNTNFRKNITFIEVYKIFKSVAGFKRSEWPQNVQYNQEQHKIYSVRMRQAKIFYKKIADDGEELYFPRNKGKVIEKIVNNNDLGEKEIWILSYILLLDAYFNVKVNYIINRSKEIIDMLTEQGLTRDMIIESAKKIIESQDKNIEELLTYDFLYYESFFMPYNKNGYNINFVSEYINASEEEKRQLYSYISYNLKNGEKDNKCIIAKKFQIIPNMGNYDKNMLIDDAKTLYVSNDLINIGVVSFNDFIKTILDSYENIENYNRALVKSIINKNIGVFQEIYYNVLNINEENNIEEVISENEINSVAEIEGPEPRADIEDDVNKHYKSDSLKKEKAKRKAGYLCELGDRNNCQYFTSKVSNKNYVEAHHLIQMEFSNDFENSIDVIANLISLCPNCHRKLHHSKDEERKGDIEYLFLKRKDQLAAKGINISFNELKKYYNIEG